MRTSILTICMICVFLSTPARADTPALGGPGGAPFKITCQDDAYLVGLAGRVGKWIDQIRPVCAPWLPDQRRFGKQSVGIPHGDSPGGNPFDRRCPKGYAVTHWYLWFTVNEDDQRKFVRALSVACQSMTSPADLQEFQIGSPLQGRDSHAGGTPSSCGYGELAVGLVGRAGLFVDALGLACAPAPQLPADLEVATGVDKLQTTVDRPSLDPTSGVGTALGSNTCLPGYVPRLAGPADDVCVPPESQSRTAQENAAAAARRNPQGGAYGPNTCLQGFVWRNAFPGDMVCVTPEVRTIVQQENALGPSRAADAPATTLMRSK